MRIPKFLFFSILTLGLLLTEVHALEGASGKVEFLRVNDMGVAYGPPADRIHAEVIFKLVERPNLFLGFQLREGNDLIANQASLEILQEAFRGDMRVNVTYDQSSNSNKGTVKAVTIAPYNQRVLTSPRRASLLVILFNPNHEGRSVVPIDDIRNFLTSNNASIRDYFRKNSNAAFDLDVVGILGWYDGDLPPSEYTGTGKPVNLRREALNKAAQDFDFAPFDQDNDGILDPRTELAVMVVEPGTTDGGRGWIRYLEREQRVDGKRVTRVAHVQVTANGIQLQQGMNNSMREVLGTVAHELVHLTLFNDNDMYFSDFYVPFAAEDYSLMDNHWNHPHLDPFWKVKFGWIEPNRATSDAIYQLTDVTRSHRVLKLADPERGMHEYFLLENRFNGNPASYDRALPDSGIAIWHIIEDPSKIPPAQVFNQNDEDKAETIRESWRRANEFRRGIRLIRPVLDDRRDDFRDLWDGAEPHTRRAEPLELSWADGTPSGFRIRDISPAAERMSLRIDTPW